MVSLKSVSSFLSLRRTIPEFLEANEVHAMVISILCHIIDSRFLNTPTRYGEYVTLVNTHLQKIHTEALFHSEELYHTYEQTLLL